MSEHLVVTVGLQIEVPIPMIDVGDPGSWDDLQDTEIEEMVMADTNRLFDAFSAKIDEMPTLEIADVSVEEREEVQPFKTIRPDGLYTLPAPSMCDRINLTTLEPTTDAPANVLSDEQARGALWALRHVWKLPRMYHAQREQILLLMSELEWLNCARPSLHRYVEVDGCCKYCGGSEPGHDA